jgi:hypothetical protein
VRFSRRRRSSDRVRIISGLPRREIRQELSAQCTDAVRRLPEPFTFRWMALEIASPVSPAGAWTLVAGLGSLAHGLPTAYRVVIR